MKILCWWKLLGNKNTLYTLKCYLNKQEYLVWTLYLDNCLRQIICINNLHEFRESCSDLDKIKMSRPQITLFYLILVRNFGGINSYNLGKLIIKWKLLYLDLVKPHKSGSLTISQYNSFIGTCKYSLMTLDLTNPQYLFWFNRSCRNTLWHGHGLYSNYEIILSRK